MTHHIRFRFVAFTFALQFGCSGATYLQVESSGHVGCEPREVTISEERVHAFRRTWTAACGERVYSCAGHERGSYCSEVLDAPPESHVVEAYAGEWQRAPFGFCPGSALFPGHAEEGVAPAPSELPPGVELRILQVVSEETAFLVGAARPASTDIDWEPVLEAAVQGVVGRTGGRLVQQVRLSDRDGYAVLVALPNDQGQLLAHVYRAGPCLYTVAVAPRAGVAKQDVVRFFEGVEVTSRGETDESPSNE